MRLSEYTDYTLRVLMYCATHRDRLVTIGELAEQHGLSKNHLMKVVNDLARQGLLETLRGRSGGLRLRVEPQTIRIGDVVRATETDFRLVECFDAATNVCTLSPHCRLKHLFNDALAGYFKTLDSVTLADMAPGSDRPTPASPEGRSIASRSVPRPAVVIMGSKPRRATRSGRAV